MMEDSKRRILKLLFVGAAIVALDYALTLYFMARSQDLLQWWVANIFHFSGGAYAFFFVKALYERRSEKHPVSLPHGFKILFFILGALAMGVFWEWWEFLIDRYGVLVLMRESVMTYPDTIGDLLLDFSGSLLGAAILFIREKQKMKVS